MDDLDRFREAQQRDPGGFATALAEMREGGKRGHWIWFVFPQLAGLGSSPAAVKFGLRGLEEATAYLRDGELRARLLEISSVVAARLRGPAPVPLTDLMGSELDARKLVSSMTLFEHAARRLCASDRDADLDRLSEAAAGILSAAEAQGFPTCAFTRRRF